MPLGILYGIGTGPGDPELITLKGARLLAKCRHVFVPKARTAAESIAMTIARSCLRDDALIHELIFPMTADQDQLSERWRESAAQVAAVLKKGEDACFLTLGDPLLYSTYLYLLRALRETLPELKTLTVPGITAFSAAASLTEFPVGEAKEAVTIIPAADNLQALRRALTGGGTVIIMKIGNRLQEIIALLKEMDLLGQCVFVSRAGMAGQRVETDLNNLVAENPETGYLSIILVHAARRNKR